MSLNQILIVIASVVLGAIVVIIAETIVPLAIDILFIWIVNFFSLFRSDSNDKT